MCYRKFQLCYQMISLSSPQLDWLIVFPCCTEEDEEFIQRFNFILRLFKISWWQRRSYHRHGTGETSLQSHCWNSFPQHRLNWSDRHLWQDDPMLLKLRGRQFGRHDEGFDAVVLCQGNLHHSWQRSPRQEHQEHWTCYWVSPPQSGHHSIINYY